MFATAETIAKIDVELSRVTQQSVRDLLYGTRDMITEVMALVAEADKEKSSAADFACIEALGRV